MSDRTTRPTFTPGPWQVVQNMWGKLAVVGPSTNGLDTTSDRVCNLPHRADGQGEANARLIAAAPDLHQALIETLPTLLASGNTLNGGEETLRIVRAALAKVDGRG